MALGQYLFGQQEMEVTMMTTVTVMVTSVVYSLCPLVLSTTEANHPGMQSHAQQHLL